MELYFLASSLGLYLLAAAGFVTHLMVVQDLPRRIALGLLGGAFGCHTAALLIRAAQLGAAMVRSSHDQLSFLAWVTVGLALALQLRYQLAIVGALVSPLAFLVTLSAFLVYSGVHSLPRGLENAWVPAHVAPAFLGYAIFAVAFCISLVYLLQENQLKGKRRSGMFRRLPSLEALDELNFRFVAWGFALFTVGIISGSLLAKMMWGTFWSWEPVQVLSLVSWILYAALLHARSSGWRGRRAATLTIVGFALLVASFIGLNFGRHSGTFG